MGAHLARCARCRERSERLRRTEERASSLLREGLPRADRRDAWARLAALRGARRSAPRLRRAASAVTALALAGAAAWVALRPAAGECFPFPAEAPPAPRPALAIRDVCCGDYDGGGLDDDGVLTLSDPDEWVRLVLVYEDADRSGAFSEGDVQRFRSAPPCRETRGREP